MWIVVEFGGGKLTTKMHLNMGKHHEWVKKSNLFIQINLFNWDLLKLLTDVGGGAADDVNNNDDVKKKKFKILENLFYFFL